MARLRAATAFVLAASSLGVAAAAEVSPAPAPRTNPPAAPASSVAAPASGAAAPSSAPSPPSGLPPWVPNPAATQKLAMGDRFLAANEYRLALYAYQDAVNLDPRSVPARLRLAALYAKLDHLEQAIRQWEFALALEPGQPEAERNAAQARAELDRRGPPAPPRQPRSQPREKPISPAEQAAPETSGASPADAAPASR